MPAGFISEAREYVIEVRGDKVDDLDLSIDETPLLALRSPTDSVARWLWSPGFYAGIIELRFSRNGKVIWSNQVTLDPDVAKLTRNEFDQMVREILADTFALFAISSARKGVGRGAGGQTPPIARLEFLRSRLCEIEKAVCEIDKSPVRVLTSQQTRATSGKPVRITSSDLAKSYRTDPLLRLPGSSPLVARFGTFFPSALRLTKRRVNLDIGEHRAIKAELKMWAAWLNVVGHNIESTPQAGEDERGASLRKRWAGQCRAMARRMQQLLSLPVFAEVADANQPLTLTSVFRWSAPYRKFFRLSSDFRVGIAKVSGDFLNIPISRTFELYELWAFLRLARAGIQVFGTKDVDVSALFNTSAKDAVRISASAVFIKLGPKFTLCFKRTYEEYWLAKPPGQSGSFSRKMIPDISFLSDADTGYLIVLDAKYRVDQQLNDAVGSLHMYRDAIVREAVSGKLPNRAVKGAYLVTPHLPDAGILEGKRDWQELILPGLLFHPAYKRVFNFGAITLKPGMTDIETTTLFKQILVDAGVAIPSGKP